MMIQRMAELDFKGKKVFDYGCGTGVLAILASRLGAKQIDAVDIEEPAYENTIENAKINQVENIAIFHGTLSAIQQTNFDIILANINRNVILESLPALYEKLNVSGIVLVSGILLEDQQLVINKALDSGFRLEYKQEKGEWTCFDFRK
jgi:ribosomal protein L11 methyltransferase